MYVDAVQLFAHIIFMYVVKSWTCQYSAGSDEETFLHDVLVILKRPFQNYQKIVKKWFLFTSNSAGGGQRTNNYIYVFAKMNRRDQ